MCAYIHIHIKLMCLLKDVIFSSTCRFSDIEVYLNLLDAQLIKYSKNSLFRLIGSEPLSKLVKVQIIEVLLKIYSGKL
jgi:hypothetical protein